MHRTRLARVVAAAVASALALVGVVAVPAQAASQHTVGGTVSLGSTAVKAGAGEVTVTLLQYYPASVNLTTTTAADGTWQFGPVDDGGYYLKFDYTGTGRFADMWWKNVPVAGSLERTQFWVGGTVVPDVTLPAPAAIAGTVSLGTNGTVPGADQVQLVVDAWDLTEDDWARVGTYPVAADGTYRVPDLLAGDYRVFADYLGTGHFQDSYWPSKHFFTYPPVRLFGGADLTGVNILLAPQHLLTGTVYLGSTAVRAGAGDATVTASCQWVDDPEEQAVDTAADGTWSLYSNSCALDVDVTYNRGSAFVGAPDIRSESQAGSTITYSTVLKAGFSMSGHVALGTAGNSAGAGVKVSVVYHAYGHDVVASTMTDAQGDWRIDGLTTAGYDLRFEVVRDAGYSGWCLAGAPGVGALNCTYDPAIVLTSNRTGLDVVIPRAPGIHGYLTDSAGEPIVNAYVDVIGYVLRGPNQGDEQRYNQVRTDSEGFFALRNLDNDHAFTVHAQAPGFAGQAWIDSGSLYEPNYISLVGDQVKSADMTMYREAVLTGTATTTLIPSGDHRYLDARATIMVKDPRSGRWVDTAYYTGLSSDGGYRFDQLNPDTYRVHITYLDEAGEASVITPAVSLDEAETAHQVSTFRQFSRDVDGDGAADVLVRNAKGNLAVFFGDLAGRFAGSAIIGSTGWKSFTAVVATGDFDADGIGDLLGRNSKGYLYFYKGDGTGLFAPRVISTSTLWKTQNVIVSPGDFDGDGTVDLISRDTAGALWLWPGDGAGSVGTRIKLAGSWKGFSALSAVSDFNEDGRPDLLARDLAGTVWLYPGNGSNGFAGRIKMASGWQKMTALFGVGDFDGDWHPDLLARDASGYLWLYPGNGNGGLSTRIKIGSTGWKAFKVAS